MNHFYRAVGNKARGMFLVVAEVHGAGGRKPGNGLRRAHVRPRRFALTAAATTLAALLATASGEARASVFVNGVEVTTAGGVGWTWTADGNLGITGAIPFGVNIISNNGSMESLDNAGFIYGRVGIWNASVDSGGGLGSIGILTNTGTIAGDQDAIENDGTITQLINSGTLHGGMYGTLYNYGALGTLTNLGLIEGTNHAVYNDFAGSIDTVDNRGTIAGARTGLHNLGTVTTLKNAGELFSTAIGIWNEPDGRIDTIVNTDLISAQLTGAPASATVAGIWNDGSIGDLTNNGTIAGGVAGVPLTVSVVGVVNLGTVDNLINNDTIGAQISDTSGSQVVIGLYNRGTLTKLANSGRIVSQAVGTITGASSSLQFLGLANEGAIGTLTNTGTISAKSLGTISGTSAAQFIAINNEDAGASIGVLDNSGTITAADIALYNAASIGAIINTGTISSASLAIQNEGAGTVGAIVNTGLIAGDITNTTANDLNISGATGTAFGVLTGAGGSVGTITNTSANVNFGPGNQLLNDNINVGSNTVKNSGAVLQLNSAITITGNYAQDKAGTLLIGVADGASATGSVADTGYGRLIVSGNATIDAGSNITLKSTGASYGFAAGQRYVVVVASGVGTYNTDSLKYAIASNTATVTGATVTDGGSTDLVLTVKDSTAGAPGDGNADGSPGSGDGKPGGGDDGTAGGSGSPRLPRAAPSLVGLQRYAGVSNAALLNLYNASLALTDSGAIRHAGAQLSPTNQILAARAAAAPTFEALNIIAQRTSDMRLARANDADDADRARRAGVNTSAGAPARGVWGQAYGGHASQGMTDGVSGYSANYGGLLVGADRAFGDRWLAGAAFSYSNTKVNDKDDNSGSSTRVNGYGLLGYASYAGSPWYVNLSAGAMQQRYSSTRVVDFTGFSGAADGHFNGQQYIARSEFGYPLPFAGMIVTPLASLTYSHLRQHSYTESGGSGAALDVDGAHSNSVRSALGAKFEKAFSSRYGDIVPYARLQWVHEYVSSRQTVAASYAADPTGQTAFTTVGAAPARNLADLALGITLLRSSTLSLSAAYNVQAGSHFVAQTGGIQLRKMF